MHLEAARRLRDAEADACRGLDVRESAINLFREVGRVVEVERIVSSRLRSGQLLSGAVLVVAPRPGIALDDLCRRVDCHLAHVAVAGGSKDDPLALPNERVDVTTSGANLVVTIRTREGSGGDVLRASQHLIER